MEVFSHSRCIHVFRPLSLLLHLRALQVHHNLLLATLLAALQTQSLQLAVARQAQRCGVRIICHKTVTWQCLPAVMDHCHSGNTTTLTSGA